MKLTAIIALLLIPPLVGSLLVVRMQLRQGCDALFGAGHYTMGLLSCGESIAQMTGVSSITCDEKGCHDQDGRPLQSTDTGQRVVIDGQTFEIASVTVPFLTSHN